MPAPVNLADAVRRAASRDPTAAALIADDAVLTWGDVDSRVDALAAGLRALDLGADKRAPARVAVALPNVPEFGVALFATLRAGLVVVPVNPTYTARELAHVLADSGASVLIGSAGVLSVVDGIAADLPALRHRYRTEDLQELAHDGARVDPRAGGDDLAALLYTSGTAGEPKGAMLTHGALIANHEQLDRVSPPILGPGDVALLALPLFHAYGLNSGLGAVAWHGACGVLVDRFDAAATLDLIFRHRVTVLVAAPQMYHAWTALGENASLSDAMASVRVAVSGAAPLDAGSARRFLAATAHPLFQGYGLTETAPVVATTLASPIPKPGSVGRPIPGVDVKLVAADGSEIARVTTAGLAGDDVEDEDGSPGTDPGEIVVRGANLFRGYWPDGRDGPDPEGWWATGDVAYADADGDLFLVDRLGELILVNGFNVYPHEVELVLSAFPGVVEAAVLGIPSESTGEAVKAYVVADPHARLTAAELLAHCGRNLARFKWPTTIEFVPELPHSATGKVRKTRLREVYP